MALYLIGDLQGCNAALQRLLDKIDFSPSRDTIYFLGDLVNRGEDSAGVLRRLMGYGASAQCLLGNHDLNLLAVAAGARKIRRKDTLEGILTAPDREAMLYWLRQQKMAILLPRPYHEPLLLVHAGVLPSWTVYQAFALAQEVETVLQSPSVNELLHQMYSNTPAAWSDRLRGIDRLRVVINALTRLRFCTAQGEMEFETTGGIDQTPAGYMPWFNTPNRQSANATIAFGHWSTVGWLHRSDVIALDSGCVWGGCLSALRFSLNSSAQELIQVRCTAASKPE
ncbi:MAG: hypothetical protein RLZZ495_186 [Pseudomonadota bacterium]|jgi:bis(5'-nucleosyl)-tetraphosphatase (symmetrical)